MESESRADTGLAEFEKIRAYSGPVKFEYESRPAESEYMSISDPVVAGFYTTFVTQTC